MRPSIVKLDVRDDLHRGREPFSRIMTTVAQLRPNESLLLIAPLEPKPLFVVLAEQGFVHDARQLASGDWEILFTRPRQSPESPRSSNPVGGKAGETEILRLDARGLEPPQPMVRILEALADLPDGAELIAHTDRRPVHLYSQLEGRGFRGQSAQQSDGSFVTRIRRE